MSKERRFNQTMRTVDGLQLPEMCENNRDTLEFLAQIDRMHRQYRVNILSAKSQEQVDMYKFHVAMTGKMLVKLAKLAVFEHSVTLNVAE